MSEGEFEPELFGAMNDHEEQYGDWWNAHRPPEGYLDEQDSWTEHIDPFGGTL
ncbi:MULTISPECIES: hypothetical protein [unclassified Nocardia]|uniref:hypothetical protein n=1 Tax=unclassified Nocardia TaxID=2637762 RepID=UPI001CE48F6D|nr:MULTISPECIES: hypothetical protein [unclassified Nocardia]